MSSISKSDGCVNYEKCGEVIVSPKDNIIKMYCNFCCQIYDNLLVFLHHLHKVHNDELGFSKPLNVYNIEELLSQTDEQLSVESNACSSVPGVPINKSDEIELGTENHAKESMKSDVVAEVEAMLFNEENVEATQTHEDDVKIKIEDTTEHGLELQQLLKDAGLHSVQVYEEHPQSMATGEADFKYTITAKQQKKVLNSKRFKIRAEKPQPTCDLKSYAIARSARQREQQKRMGNIKRRIFRSLENEPDFFIPKMNSRVKESTAYKALVNQIDAKETLNGKNKCATNTFPKSPLIITKVEILPSLNLSKPEQKIEKRRISLTVVNSPPMVDKKLNRRPSFESYTTAKTEQVIEEKQSINTSPQQTNKRERLTTDSGIETKRAKTELNPSGSPNFNLSDSVLELLKSDFDTTDLNTDSLLELAEPSDKDSFDIILNQVKEEMQAQQQIPAAIASKNVVEDKDVLRTDLTLLKIVGLPIIKDPFVEDHKPIEFSEMLRKKAAKFTKSLHSFSAVWSRNRFKPQLIQKTLHELAMLREEVNNNLKGNLNVSELKRILNLINVWYAQQNNLKFFKKAKFSTSIDYYMQLLGFLPRISICSYFCEWCDQSSCNQPSYEKHRQYHLGELSCPHCNRVFKKRGFLTKHVLMIHGENILQ